MGPAEEEQLHRSGHGHEADPALLLDVTLLGGEYPLDQSDHEDDRKLQSLRFMYGHQGYPLLVIGALVLESLRVFKKCRDAGEPRCRELELIQVLDLGVIRGRDILIRHVAVIVETVSQQIDDLRWMQGMGKLGQGVQERDELLDVLPDKRGIRSERL